VKRVEKKRGKEWICLKFNVAEEEDVLAIKKQMLLEEDVNRLKGISEATMISINVEKTDNERVADQTLKMNCIHYVETKDKPVVVKKSRSVQNSAKQKMLQYQKSSTLSGDDGTLHLSNRDSDGVLVDAVERRFDIEAFIPDTPVDDSPCSRLVRDLNDAVDDDKKNVKEEIRPTKIPLNIEWDEWYLAVIGGDVVSSSRRSMHQGSHPSRTKAKKTTAACIPSKKLSHKPESKMLVKKDSTFGDQKVYSTSEVTVRSRTERDSIEATKKDENKTKFIPSERRLKVSNSGTPLIKKKEDETTVSGTERTYNNAAKVSPPRISLPPGSEMFDDCMNLCETRERERQRERER